MYVKSALETSRVFEGVSERNLDYLAAESRVRHFNPRQLLMRQGQEGHAAYLLVRGYVRVERQGAEDGPRLVAMVGPGQIVGEIAVLEQTPRSASVVAAGRVTAIELPAKALRKVVSEEAALDERLMRTIRERATVSASAVR